MELRLLAVFLVGTIIAGQLNRAIYWLALSFRAISPWSPPDPAAPPRVFWDRIPVIGWLGLRRESPIHGEGHWARPLLIELATGAALAGLYWWETGHRLMPAGVADYPADATIFWQFVLHAALLAAMIVATFIDFDEQVIPDEITLPGTLFALLMAPCFEVGLPVRGSGNGPQVVPLQFDEIHPTWIHGPRGLAIAIAIAAIWCAAITAKTWTTRHGLSKAVCYMLVSIQRHRTWVTPLLVFTAVSLWAYVIWRTDDATGWRWRSLLSSLIGLAFGGGVVWAVRIAGGHALGQEAMGFGDVTLMAMIGAFLGWQPATIVFFLAPFAALAISVAQFLLTRHHAIAYGPYLCLAALVSLVGWRVVWDSTGPYFHLGIGTISAIIGSGLAVMWVALRLIRSLRREPLDEDEGMPGDDGEVGRLCTVFVYGTLKRGEERAPLWPHEPLWIKPGIARGHLYDLGPYPALAAGDDRVHGELWHFRGEEMEATLAVLDRIECSENETDRYVRQPTTCQADDGEAHAAYAYFLPRVAELPTARRVVPDSDGICRWTGQARPAG